MTPDLSSALRNATDLRSSACGLGAIKLSVTVTELPRFA